MNSDDHGEERFRIQILLRHDAHFGFSGGGSASIFPGFDLWQTDRHDSREREDDAHHVEAVVVAFGEILDRRGDGASDGGADAHEDHKDAEAVGELVDADELDADDGTEGGEAGWKEKDSKGSRDSELTDSSAERDGEDDKVPKLRAVRHEHHGGSSDDGGDVGDLQSRELRVIGSESAEDTADDVEDADEGERKRPFLRSELSRHRIREVDEWDEEWEDGERSGDGKGHEGWREQKLLVPDGAERIFDELQVSLLDNVLDGVLLGDVDDVGRGTVLFGFLAVHCKKNNNLRFRSFSAEETH